jgi:hypothetical protein
LTAPDARAQAGHPCCAARSSRSLLGLATGAARGLTKAHVAIPDAKAPGSFDLTASGGGTVTLVAPRKISFRSLAPSLERTVGSFTTLTLHFVPEPSQWLLLAAGARWALAPR